MIAHSGKNMISSTFWKKSCLAAHSGEKNMISSTFWQKNMVGSTFWGK
jgi:hypothetical protein